MKVGEMEDSHCRRRNDLFDSKIDDFALSQIVKLISESPHGYIIISQDLRQEPNLTFDNVFIRLWASSSEPFRIASLLDLLETVIIPRVKHSANLASEPSLNVEVLCYRQSSDHLASAPTLKSCLLLIYPKTVSLN